MVGYQALPLQHDFAEEDPSIRTKCQQPESLLIDGEVTPPVSVSKPPRVASLDVFRGLCVFLMMLVDYGGAIFPLIAHSPWNGVHLADFVMPFFLFVAGIALAIVYKRVPNRVEASSKAITRALKLFILGVFLQGGYLHGTQSLTYGVDMDRLRWMGILQRIAIAYAVTANCEIWLPFRRSKRASFFRSYLLQWCLVILLSSIYFWLSYGLLVPDWEFKASDDIHVYKVKCGVRGDLGPACNSAAMIDRYILGINHLYAKPVYRNLKECNMSRDGAVPESSPSWCHSPFDPEGLLGDGMADGVIFSFYMSFDLFLVNLPYQVSVHPLMRTSLTAAVTCILGLQFGHVLVQLQDHKERLWKWSIFSISLFVLGLLFVFIGVPLNKPLYTISYTLLTSGTAGITFCALYILVDVYGYRKVTYILEWMGIHSLTIFVLITSNIAILLLQGFYIKNPSNNIIHWIISCFVSR